MNNALRSKKNEVMPLCLFNIYIIITLLVSFFGPAQYRGYNKVPVLVFMLAFLLVFNIGYLIGLRLCIRKENADCSRNEQLFPQKLIRFSLYISLFGVFLFLLRDLASSTFSLSLSKIGENYIGRDSFGGNNYPVAYLYRFFTGFFRYVAMCLPVMYYQKLTRAEKITFWIFIGLYFIENCIIQGSQKVALDIVLFSGIPYVLRKSQELSAKSKRQIVIVGIVVFVGLLLFLSYTQYMRYSAIGINATNYGEVSSSGMYFDTDHIFFSIFGDKLGFGFASILCGYMSAGYYGLSLCLSLPFKWTYGLGSSLVLSRLVDRIFGYNAYMDTYLYRMLTVSLRKGLTTWNTIFPWLASDYTFIGAIILFFFVAMLFAFTWREVTEYKNPISLLMFSTIVLALIFVPANNQLFTGIDGFISTWVTMIVWVFYHNRFNLIEHSCVATGESIR